MFGHDITTIMIAFLAAANCGFLGSFVMLRKKAMLGDAIAHAIVPGIVIMFLLTKSMHPLFFGLGALVSGLGVTLLIGFLNQRIGVTSGAAIELGAACFFALGILLISVYAKSVDLDPSCVWHSSLEIASLDVMKWGRFEIPRAFLLLAMLLLLNIGFIFWGYRALFFMAFDASFAKSMGLSVARWDRAFMLLVAFNIVVCFRIINAPLVVGFLTMPPAIAWLVADSLPMLLGYTFVVSGILAINGYWAAKVTGLSLTGMMMVLGGVLFLGLSWLVQRKANPKSRKGKSAGR